MDHHQNRLISYRKRYALSQGEVGNLLGLSPDAIGNYELGERMPSLGIGLGLELIFGRPLAYLFPDLLQAVADAMIVSVQEWSAELQGNNDEASKLKHRLISDIGDRLDQANAGL